MLLFQTRFSEGRMDSKIIIFKKNKMELQTTKKLFAFIITVLMFSIVTESANAQRGKGNKNPKTYNCICGFTRNFGCPNGDTKCHLYCVGICGINTPGSIPDTSLKTIYNPDSQSATISYSLSQSAKITLKIFDLN